MSLLVRTIDPAELELSRLQVQAIVDREMRSISSALPSVTFPPTVPVIWGAELVAALPYNFVVLEAGGSHSTHVLDMKVKINPTLMMSKECFPEEFRLVTQDDERLKDLAFLKRFLSWLVSNGFTLLSRDTDISGLTLDTDVRYCLRSLLLSSAHSDLKEKMALFILHHEIAHATQIETKAAEWIENDKRRYSVTVETFFVTAIKIMSVAVPMLRLTDRSLMGWEAAITVLGVIGVSVYLAKKAFDHYTSPVAVSTTHSQRSELDADAKAVRRINNRSGAVHFLQCSIKARRLCTEDADCPADKKDGMLHQLSCPKGVCLHSSHGDHPSDWARLNYIPL